MPVRAPSVKQVLDAADSFGIALTMSEAEGYADLMKGMAASISVLDTYPEPKLPVSIPALPDTDPALRKIRSMLGT